jgi:hypothetical protein
MENCLDWAVPKGRTSRWLSTWGLDDAEADQWSRELGNWCYRGADWQNYPLGSWEKKEEEAANVISGEIHLVICFLIIKIIFNAELEHIPSMNIQRH